MLTLQVGKSGRLPIYLCMVVAAGTAGTAMAVPLFAPPLPEHFFVSAILTEYFCKLQ